MNDPAQIYELVLRGIAVGALAASAAGVWRVAPGRPVRVAALCLCVTVIAYAVQSSPLTRNVLGPAEPLVRFLALSGAGFVWVFIVTLFEDRPLSPATLAPPAGLTVLGLIGWAAEGNIREGVWIAHNLIEAGLAIHALTVIARSWRGDLVEARRRLRGPFLGIVTLYVMTLSSLEIAESFGVAADWYSLAGAVALATFCFAGAALFLRGREELLGAAQSAPGNARAGAGFDAADRLVLEKLGALMDAGEAWRREGLTIGALAAEVGVPEHRLRRLINDHLGHRNFAAFVNARRIEAAKRLLADPTLARKPVSAIAFELGFGSLGPFNRAFKEAAGATPSQWRREALGAEADTEAPISENPG